MLEEGAIGEFLNKPQKEGFLDQEIHKRARKDFEYLLQKNGLGKRYDLNFFLVFGASGDIANCLVLGLESKSKRLVFPREILNGKTEGYVTVVLYDEGNVEDMLMYPISELLKKKKLFSIYKYDKSKDEYTIKINKKDNTKRLSIVLKDYIK